MKKVLNELRYYFLPKAGDPDKIGQNYLGSHMIWLKEYENDVKMYGVERARNILDKKIDDYNHKDKRIVAEAYTADFIFDLVKILEHMGYKNRSDNYDEYKDNIYDIYVSNSSFYNTAKGVNYVRSTYITVNSNRDIVEQFTITITDHPYDNKKDDPIFSRAADISLDIHKDIFRHYESSMLDIVESLVEKEREYNRLSKFWDMDLESFVDKFTSRGDL